ncbi:MAG: aldehyde dehydrogenase [Ruminococcus sp.]|nr:aldehyde dehydrogenase [Ruminococcus sp.]
MNTTEINRIAAKQRQYFQTGETFSVSFRLDMLRKLRGSIKKHEAEILTALDKDMGKSRYEAYMCEIGMVLSEISFLLKNTSKLAAPQRVRTPLAQFISRSFIQAVPYGNTLIISPWNYPFLLALGPLADAIAAGNTAIVKPGECAPETAAIIEKILSECYPKKYIAVVQGGKEENLYLLRKKFDFVFFTGSQAVGKIVLKNAAEYLTPVVLELGGKSPVIVDETAKLPLAARRIVFGKLINCGQTCVAPDYILCDKKIKNALIRYLIIEIKRQLGEKPFDNKNYGRIVNKKHFDRLCGMIDASRVVFGGKKKEETLQIEPVIMDNVTWEDAVMSEEIFGPILPVMTFESIGEVYSVLKNRPRPLALYMFSENRKNIDFIMQRTRFGGGCINDTVIHVATENMGFGGVGESGMGASHGKAGFDAFSHYKSIVDKKTILDLPMRYQPYNEFYYKLIRMFLR